MEILIGQGHVRAGISERIDGSMVWQNRLPVSETILRNRDNFFRQHAIDPTSVVAGGIEHGATIAVVGRTNAGQYLVNTDGLLTKEAGVFLSVTVADCLPIYLYDRVNHAIGIAHAGWRGVVRGMPSAVVSAMVRACDTSPENLDVVIGPYIHQHHYPVSQDVADQFPPSCTLREHDQVFLDLGAAAHEQLTRAGVDHVTLDTTCTWCAADRLFSARHDQCDPLQGAVAYIGMTSA